MSTTDPAWRSDVPPGGWDQPQPTGDEADYERVRKLLIISGTIAIAAGIGAMLVPELVSASFSVLIGCALLLASLGMAVAAFAAPGVGLKLMRGFMAFATFAFGLYLIVSPLEGAFTLTVMLVIWFVVMGVIRITTGMTHIGQPGAGQLILAGVVSLVLGILIGRELPSSADWAIGLLVGIDLLLYGGLVLARVWLAGEDSRTVVL